MSDLIHDRHSPIEAAKVNGLEPFADLRYLAGHPPRANSDADLEPRPSLRIDRALLAAPKARTAAQAIATA